MAITRTDILNNALTRIGAASVTSIDDDTNNARVLSRVYELSLKSVLGECKWNFATKRAMLSVSTDELAWYESGITNVYIKPIDMIRIYSTNVKKAYWKEEGDYIISDASGLGVLYVYFLDVPSKYPGFFVDALVDKLCSDIAYMIVNSATLGEKFKLSYEKISLPRATAANSQTGDQQYLQDDAWELSKYNNLNSLA